MKRKRGKKGTPKKAAEVGTAADPNVADSSTEDVSGPDDTEKDETSSKMDIETPSSTGTDQPEKPAPVIPIGVTDKPVGRLVYNRVKVKIKPSKALEPQITPLDAHTPSDTDKSSQHMGNEKQVVGDKVDDSVNSVPESNVVVSTTQPKKAGSIKIKSKGFSSSLSPCNNAGVAQVESKPEGTHQKEATSVSRDSVYNKQELNKSLEVIKKIMKMDAAEPFNVPVNPVALGIPDYFDVIKTPMDFSTICNNLESGLKYMNSEDVYKDVQYIWENCYKYNNKGDYILELMKRVKKNFSKYWSAAALYNEHSQGDGNISSHGKSSKGGNQKHKSRKRHGVKRHKDDCLCAVCIMMRRRQEREQILRSADDQTETSDGLVQEVKPEGTSAMGSLNGDDTSSSTDNSQNQDADTEMEDKGEEVNFHSKQQEDKGNETPIETNKVNVIAIGEQSQAHGNSGSEKHGDIQMPEAGDARNDDGHIEEKTVQHGDETAAKPKVLLDSGAMAKLGKDLRQRYENPMFLELCASLFSENPKSLWSRPHSLVNRRHSSRNSAIGDAIATFMK